MTPTKMLGLLVVAAAAVLAFASTASATTVTSSEGETPAFESANESGHVSFHGSNGTTIECASQLQGSVENHGASRTAEAKITLLSFSSCTNGSVIHVKAKGWLIIHGVGAGSGTVTWSGAEWEETRNTIFGTISCVFQTKDTDLGTLTGSSTTGGKATLDVSAMIPRTGGSSVCGSSSTFTGAYAFTAPASLNFD